MAEETLCAEPSLILLYSSNGVLLTTLVIFLNLQKMSTVNKSNRLEATRPLGFGFFLRHLNLENIEASFFSEFSCLRSTYRRL